MVVDEPHDSFDDTLAHSDLVGMLLRTVRTALIDAAGAHDRSKFESPEKEVFDVVTPRLKSLTYGSDEYRASLADMGPALEHHYAHNRHHPEHHPDGVDSMNLIDVIEMLCDWKAATTRHDDGDIGKSITINAERFGLSPQLVSILRNTAEALGWQ